MANRHALKFGLLGAGLEPADTEITFGSDPGFGTVTLSDDPVKIGLPGGREAVYLTEIVDGELTGTIVRAREGTVAASHDNDAEWWHGPMPSDFTAAEIGIADQAGNYTASDVEAALAEVYDLADTAAGGGVTLEQVFDALGTGGLIAGMKLSATYDDPAGTITLDVDATVEDTSNKGAASGYAPLDAGALIPSVYLPPLATGEMVPVADEADRYALTVADVQNGDRVVQENNGTLWWVVDDTNLGNAAGYVEVSSTSAVVSVNGATGAVTVTEATEANVVDALDGAALPATTVGADDKVIIQDYDGASAVKTVTAQAVADLTPSSGVHHVVYNAPDWIYQGNPVTARPTNIPAWPAARILFSSATDATLATFGDLPSWVATGDQWEPHGTVDPT